MLTVRTYEPQQSTHTDHAAHSHGPFDQSSTNTVFSIYTPPMRRVVLRLPTCAFYQASSQPGSPRSYYPCYRQYLLGSRLPRPRLLPRSPPLSHPSSASLPGTLNDILTLVFVYTLVGIFALLLLASLVYFALRCLEPPSPDP